VKLAIWHYAIRPLSVCPVCNIGVLWPNGWMDQDETWLAGRPRPWPHCVRWGSSSLSPNRRQSPPPPKFSAHLYCGQTAGSIKMALSMEVSLDPGHIVLDGNPAPLAKKGGTAPCQFSAHLYCGHWPNCWMHQDATWYGGRTQHRPQYARWAPSSPSPKRGQSPLP